MKNALIKLRQQSDLLQLAVQVVEWNNVARGDHFEVTEEAINHQVSLVKEESEELDLAIKNNDIIEIYDALADIFVVNSYYIVMLDSDSFLESLKDSYDWTVDNNYNIDCLIDCIKEVMRSNWTKFSSYQLTSNEFNVVKRGGLWLLFDNNGKIRKPECYEKPNLKPILEKHGVI
ncbi:hypothetical protein [Thorsellia kenyensis]|uniref:Uncharacterized protein n=1 Tax=Thorsellia kenyensis TaxID=1549888 RepID=A0ABV6C7K3_9GAMM